MSVKSFFAKSASSVTIDLQTTFWFSLLPFLSSPATNPPTSLMSACWSFVFFLYSSRVSFVRVVCSSLARICSHVTSLFR